MKKIDIAFLIFGNLGLYGLCMFFSIALIQHSAFFYTFPPDPNRLLHVPLQTYILLSILLFFAFKLQHYLEKKAAILKEEGGDLL